MGLLPRPRIIALTAQESDCFRASFLQVPSQADRTPSAAPRLHAKTRVRILLGETLVGKTGEEFRKSWGPQVHDVGRILREGKNGGQDVGWSILESWKGCWGGLEPLSPTLSPSVTSCEQHVSEHSAGGPGSVLLPAERGLRGDSHTGSLTPSCVGCPGWTLRSRAVSGH